MLLGAGEGGGHGGDLVGKRSKAWLPPSVGKAQYIGLSSRDPKSFLQVFLHQNTLLPPVHGDALSAQTLQRLISTVTRVSSTKFDNVRC